MKRIFALAAGSLAALSACAAPLAAPDGSGTAEAVSDRPLEVLPAEAGPALVRRDLLATAADRFGAAALAEARAAPTHLIVKRFAGMAPPPPPGAGMDWRPVPQAALLARRTAGWMVADDGGWRPADPGAAAELDRILVARAFWSEPAYTPPCPDFGASLVLLKAPGRPETVRNSTCMSRTADLVQAALRA